MANRNWMNGGKLFKMHASPVEIDLSFQVQSDDSAGLGIKNLVGPCVSAVYMTTSATKAAGAPGGSTGPAAGTIVIRLQDNYNELLGIQTSIMQSPNSGSALKIDHAELTAGVAYTITIVGNATAAQWKALGLPVGVTPAVGASFIASATGSGSGNSSSTRVQAAADAGSGIFSIEVVGNPQLSISPAPSANQGYGAQIILECRADSAADAPTIAAPADGTVIGIKLLFNNSSVKIQGS